MTSTSDKANRTRAAQKIKEEARDKQTSNTTRGREKRAGKGQIPMGMTTHDRTGQKGEAIKKGGTPREMTRDNTEGRMQRP